MCILMRQTSSDKQQLFVRRRDLVDNYLLASRQQERAQLDNNDETCFSPVLSPCNDV